MNTVSHSIIGLPVSGKTTFLAALWHLIDAGEINTNLVLEKMIGDHQYLNDIVEAWRRCRPVPRTSLASETSVAIHVREVSSGKEIIFNFTDLAGESFERQFSTRQCARTYIDTYEEPGGVLLFVTADRGIDGITIVDLAPLVEPDAQPTATRVREWSPEMVPVQVRLVDLLQFIQMGPFKRRKRKLVVAVSAWDVVPNPKPTPSEWLERELPLLYQFLLTNEQSFEFRVYGISAQGGQVQGKNDAEVLASRNMLLGKTPSERILCEGHGVSSPDLTIPLVWLTEE
jgi:hypothetical protein